MSALPTQVPASSARIDLEEVAYRLKITRRAAQMRVEQWQREGYAKFEVPPEGGRAKWLVLEIADPALSPFRRGDEIPSKLANLHPKFRDEVAEKRLILAGWEAAIKGRTKKLTEIAAEYLSSVEKTYGVSLSYRQLQRWIKQHRFNGADGLIDRRWPSPAKDKALAEDPFIQACKRHYETQRRKSVTLCYELAVEDAAGKDWHVPSYHTIARYFREKMPMAEMIFKREGEKAFNDKAARYIERDYGSIATNDVWNSDHHELDIFIELPSQIDKGTGEVKRRFSRPWLTAWQDARSRKIVGWMIYDHAPNTDTILLTLRAAVKAHGVPVSIMVDNRKDYDSFALHGRTKTQRRHELEDAKRRVAGAFAMLQIEAHNVQRYHGQSKPIERFFRTVSDRFGRHFESYCGNKPENRPEELQRNLEAGKAPKLEELVEAFGEWVEVGYNAHPHTGDSMDGFTPNQVFARELQTKRTAPADVLELLTQKTSPPLKVGRNGVRWNHIRYGQTEHALIPHMGKFVTLMQDPDDATQVKVWTPEGKFICIAKANVRMPFKATSQEVREAIAEQRRD
jgi:transposase InsO family protein